MWPFKEPQPLATTTNECFDISFYAVVAFIVVVVVAARTNFCCFLWLLWWFCSLFFIIIQFSFNSGIWSREGRARTTRSTGACVHIAQLFPFTLCCYFPFGCLAELQDTTQRRKTRKKLGPFKHSCSYCLRTKGTQIYLQLFRFVMLSAVVGAGVCEIGIFKTCYSLKSLPKSEERRRRNKRTNEK